MSGTISSMKLPFRMEGEENTLRTEENKWNEAAYRTVLKKLVP